MNVTESAPVLPAIDRYRRQQGLRTPARLGAVSLLKAIPGLAAQLRPIPGRYVRFNTTDRTHEVFCPCDRRPVVESNHFSRCHCGRIYLYGGGDQIWVGNTPSSTPTPGGVA